MSDIANVELEADEIEITPEMIAAGGRVLFNHYEIGDYLCVIRAEIIAEEVLKRSLEVFRDRKRKAFPK